MTYRDGGDVRVWWGRAQIIGGWEAKRLEPSDLQPEKWSPGVIVTARQIALASSPMGYMVLGLRLIGVGLAGALRSWTGWKRRC